MVLTSPYRKPPILPPAEHPRLMLREGDRERIEAGLSHPENHRECGWGKVIISPRDRRCEHHFKVRMQLMDATM